MKVIYKSICDEIVEKQHNATLNNRTITKIILTKAEYDEFKREIRSVAAYLEDENGFCSMYYGVPIEVEK